MQSSSNVLKLKNKEAANKLRNGAPKFKEVLRQRCRDQIRKKRHELFNSHRPGLADDVNVSIQETLTEIVRQELSGLSTSMMEDNDNFQKNVQLMSQEELIAMEEDIIKEEEQWIMEEYEALQQYENDMMDKWIEETLKDVVICPMCVKGEITENFSGLICPVCGLSLPRLTLDKLSSGIKKQLSIHNENCSDQPIFTTLAENNLNLLYLTCDTCSLFTLIT